MPNSGIATKRLAVSTHNQICSSMGVNTVGNIISAEKTFKSCNYPGRSRVTRLGIYITNRSYSILVPGVTTCHVCSFFFKSRYIA